MDQYVKKYQKDLRCGITTGTCATAAARACAMQLLLGIEQCEQKIQTPKGTIVLVPVSMQYIDNQKAEYMVLKDSGDDPDVTNGAKVLVTLEKLAKGDNVSEYVFTDEAHKGLFLDGGKGIGRVTKAGLEQRIGQAAINVVPRKMIFEAVEEVRKMAEYVGNLQITVSMPEGEELAKRTFNGRLGIEGGLSILGTSGILEPMSEKAIVDTIETQIRQLTRNGKKELLVTPGNYGQGYVSEYLGFDLSDSIKCSNYIGDTIDLAISYGVTDFLLVGNIGKLVKLAGGIMNTHSKIADGRADIFMANAALCGANREQLLVIRDCITTEEMLEQLQKFGIKDAVVEKICQRIEEYVGHRVGEKMRFGVILFSEKYGYLGETSGSSKICKKFSNI